jgi:hypothetical protein
VTALALAVTGANAQGSLPAPKSEAKVVIQWNVNAHALLKELHPYEQVRWITMVHAAMHDAVNTVTPKYTTFATVTADAAGAREALAAAFAAYAVLAAAKPDRKAVLDEMLKADLAAVTDAKQVEKSKAVGAAAAKAIIDHRKDDRFADKVEWKAPTATTVGMYQLTAGSTAPVCPQCPKVKPWVLKSGDQFRAPPPPSLDSKEWLESYKQVRELGAANSTKRTREQTDLALFFLPAPWDLWNIVARDVAAKDDKGLHDTARAFALLYVAQFDATIACHDNKWLFLLWRPETSVASWEPSPKAVMISPDAKAIVPDKEWRPLAKTPGHPEYTAAHATISTAAAEVLTSIYGEREFETTSPGTKKTLRFKNFMDMATQAGQSRIYAGFHYAFSVTAGADQGTKVGQYVVRNSAKVGEK